MILRYAASDISYSISGWANR